MIVSCLADKRGVFAGLSQGAYQTTEVYNLLLLLSYLVASEVLFFSAFFNCLHHGVKLSGLILGSTEILFASRNVFELAGSTLSVHFHGFRALV